MGGHPVAVVHQYGRRHNPEALKNVISLNSLKRVKNEYEMRWTWWLGWYGGQNADRITKNFWFHAPEAVRLWGRPRLQLARR
jgi:hypothetical protein